MGSVERPLSGKIENRVSMWWGDKRWQGRSPRRLIALRVARRFGGWRPSECSDLYAKQH